MKRKAITKIAAVLAALLIVMSGISSAFAATIGSESDEIDLSEYGDIISNEELGEIVSYSGYITKDEYAEILSKRTGNSVSASVHPSFEYCTDTNGNYIKVVKSMASQYVGETALYITINGKRAYCIEPGEPLKIYSDISTPNAWSKLGEDKQKAINVALAYGWEGNSSAIKSGTTINTYQGYIATQLIIWEIVNGQRSTSSPYTLKSGKSGYLSMYCANGKNGNIKTAYNRIVKAMASYQTLPSFTNKSYSDAPTYTINCSYNAGTGKWTYGSLTLNDSNNILSSFKDLAGTYTIGKATVKVTITGKKLTVKVTKISDVSETSYTKTISAEKTGIPSSSGKIITYGSPTVQDTVTVSASPHIDPPNAYMNIKINVDSSGFLLRDGKIQKAVWTESESEDPDVDEGEGTLSTSENLKGWYFYVYSVPKEFEKAYGVSSFVLGPTDSSGFTQSLSEWVKENCDYSNVSSIIPMGYYDYTELGKLKSGAKGTDLKNDYYIPENYSTIGTYGTSASHKGSIRFASDTEDVLNVVSYADNIYRIPTAIQKVCEAGDSAEGYYFSAVNDDTSDEYILKTNSNGYAYIINSDDSVNEDISVLDDEVWKIFLPEGNYTVTELGKKNSSGDYYMPDLYPNAEVINIEISSSSFVTAQQSGLDCQFYTITNNTQLPICIYKTDKYNTSAVPGATYVIYSDESCENALESLTTDSNGFAQTVNGYGTGTYYIKESSAPSGYKLDETIYTVNVAPIKNGKTVYKIPFYLTDIPTGSITITKTSDDKVVSGMYFKITSDDGYSNTVQITKKAGTKKVTNLDVYNSKNEAITYTVEELGFLNESTGEYFFPSKYVKPENRSFTLANSSYHYDVTFNNEVPTGALKIMKTSADDVVENIWFKVTNTTTNEVIGYYKTDSMGVVSVADLPISEYDLSSYTDIIYEYEIEEMGFSSDNGKTFTFPSKYVKPGNKTVTLTASEYDSNGATNPTTVKFRNKLTSMGTMITLYKKDINGNSLSGSQWQLYTADGTLVHLTQTGDGRWNYYSYSAAETLTTDSKGCLKILNITAGDYYLLETSSPSKKIPYGKKIEFSITDTDTDYVFTVTDNNVTMLNTGGSGNTQFYIIGFTGLSISLVFIIILMHKKKKSEIKI